MKSSCAPYKDCLKGGSRRLTYKKNILGKPLKKCSVRTGFYRDGYCMTGSDDHGTHTVCAKMDKEFLEYTKNKGNNLSGGERRRVEISRTLAMDPDFILLDEPFAGVDPIAVEDIQSIVSSLKERNIGVLITDHNVRETLSITDRSYLLFDGKILKSGSSEFLANDEEAKRLYLGEGFTL